MGILKHIRDDRFARAVGIYLITGLALALVTLARSGLNFRLAAVSLLYVIVIVLVARFGSLVPALIASIIATALLAYIAPPSSSLTRGDALDIVAVATFLIVAVTIAELVSRLRRMNEEIISSVDRRLIQAEERERSRVARELHDDINQRMALVSVNLDGLRDDLASLNPRLRQSFEEIRGQISDLSADIQSVSHQLHSSKLHLLGITVAATSLCKELGKKHVAEIEMQSDGVPKSLPDDVAVSLFRVLQEALQNALKHSRSSHVEVRLSGIPSGIELSVRDAGVGFDPEAAMKSSGLGLISMQERIKLVKGEFSVSSQVNRGTTILVRVPLGDGQTGVAN